MQQTLVTATHADSKVFLRNTLLANATFSALCGLLGLFDARGVDHFLGLGMPSVVLLLGIGLLFFAGVLLWVATRPQIQRGVVQLITALDIGWVVGSALLLWSQLVAFSNGGWWAVAIIADIIAFFALLEVIGLRKLESAK